MKMYYQKMLKTLDNLESKKTLLLHSCCGPCSTHVISLLAKYFDITVFYYNPNIVPEAEYLKRKEEQIRFLNEYDQHIKFIDGDYDNQDLLISLKPYPRIKEMDERCYYCYYYRMNKTALKAQELRYDFFTTTLSVSPYKSTKYINEIGEKLALRYHIGFLNSDFKKDNGYKKSIELAQKYNLYRQDYCGCNYSLQDSIIRRRKENEKI